MSLTRNMRQRTAYGHYYGPVPKETITSIESKICGGGSGIGTHDTVARIHAFQACAFSHSAIPPLRDGGNIEAATPSASHPAARGCTGATLCAQCAGCG